ncbi:MAG: phospholipase A [Undibacterium sp.]|nr:phospholipase A [Opitutaceae bacterium]
MRKFISILVIAALATVARAQFETLLVPPAEPVQAGKVMRVTLFLNNPSTTAATFKFPAVMTATFASPSEQRTLPVGVVDIATGTEIELLPMSFTRTTLTVLVPDTLAGNVSMRILEPQTNPIMFIAVPAATVGLNPKAMENAERAAANQPRDLSQDTAFDKMRRHLLPYEPIYFSVGANDRINARFQFSFRFRPLTPKGNVSKPWQDLYAAYTQTSLWDLESLSKPFYDTSYKPTLFYGKDEFDVKLPWIDRLGAQIGVQHESNGQALGKSRSLNTVYFRPVVTWKLPRDWQLAVSPRFIGYFDKDENPDLEHYRGYVEWLVALEHRSGFKITANLRKGTSSGYGSGEINASWPLDNFFPELGGRLLVQYFNGWGESLLDYNIRRPDQFRLGFMVVP